MLAPEVIESAEKRVGETVGGKWHLDRVIGVGGMAAVYEATHRNRNRVAIKLLHRPLSLDEGTRHRFLREGYVANTIRHSGAVQILDDDLTEEGVAFLVMELLRGESVDERMVRKGGALEIHEALNIADQLLDVLGAAHDQNVIHRDIKPDNLFLTEEGKLKVLDFGIARLHQGDTRATKVGSFMGTPAFCAPEQARGRWDEVDLRTDLFSVGATLFTCLSGTHVHEAETSSEQLALAISASARSLAEVLPGAPDELVALVDKALAYDKEDRFQSARAMRAAAQRVMAGLTGFPDAHLAPRRISAPPPGGVTMAPLEPNETDGAAPDSVMPSNFPAAPFALRALVGLLAAGLLATLVLIFAQSRSSSGPETAGATSEVKSLASEELQAEKEAIDAADADSAPSAKDHEVKNAGELSENEGTAAGSAVLVPVQDKSPGLAPRITPQPVAPAPRANSSAPSPSPAPSPSSGPSGSKSTSSQSGSDPKELPLLGDSEDDRMFDGRF